MKKTITVLFCLGVLATAGLWADEARMLDYAQKLAKTFTQDGLTIVTGVGGDGRQNLAVLAKGGYFPLQLKAKAGVPSVLHVYTDKTYDCGRSFFLPNLKLQAGLPPKGDTTFAIPAQKKGSTLFGSCGMGMYTFEIVFE